MNKQTEKATNFFLFFCRLEDLFNQSSKMVLLLEKTTCLKVEKGTSFSKT